MNWFSKTLVAPLVATLLVSGCLVQDKPTGTTQTTAKVNFDNVLATRVSTVGALTDKIKTGSDDVFANPDIEGMNAALEAIPELKDKINDLWASVYANNPAPASGADLY